MVIKSILNIAPTLQAAALVGHNLEVAKKKDKKVGDIVGLGVTNIVGTSLIKTQFDLIGAL